MNTNQNSFTDLEHLELVARRIADSGADLTSDYQSWMAITFACASLGEGARECYHLICSQYPGYKRDECDQKFTNCLEKGKGMVTLGTLMKLAADAGIDISKPRGRRPQTASQKQQQAESKMNDAYSILRSLADWRFNIWLNRAEIKEPKKEWRPAVNRDLSTYYCRLKAAGVNVSANDLEHIINSRDFAIDHDPFVEYLHSLPEWHEGDPDYIHEFFVGHMVFGDPENTEFYDTMFHKWFLGMVDLWLGKAEENPIMPVLHGHQHIGKTFYVRHILPPQLASYMFPVNPSTRVDKDFEIAMSETPLMFLDEFSVSNLQKSEAYKYAITASKSYLRDSYDHFREMRTRKASLIAATNHDTFIREAEGDRRYLAVNLTGTVNLNEHPLPYAGAYAQALWLLDHGFKAKPTQQESELISEHNLPYLIPDDVDEALRTFVRMPSDTDNPEAYTAGDLLNVLYTKGFRGPKYTSQAIAKAMKGMGFDTIRRQGRNKYVVVIADAGRQQCERKKDVDDVEPF